MEGYPQLSAVMASHSDIAIFRNFRALNTQNLLHLQAELVHLEKELQEIIKEDSQCADPSRQQLHHSWEKLNQSLDPGNDRIQWDKCLEIRQKLREYNSALLQVSHLSALPSPGQPSLDVLHEWLIRPKYGNGFLKGVESQTWDLEKGRADYVTLSTKQAEQDFLTRWIYKLIPGTLHRFCGHRFKKPEANVDAGNDLFEYNDSHLNRTAHTLSSALSSLMPTLSIFVLYYVRNMPARLGLILAFTTIFAATLELVSNAKRVEVFAVTTAFAAVQVVFVGSTNNPLG